MSDFTRSELVAVLGPTNTGKTHLAIERLCGHSSGMIGFPLRLLAREVYDRVVAVKGANQVALITGEEKILPPDARWFLCTAESMPLERDLAFVALDEAQLGANPERGHVFTDRLLRARGREETMILGADTLRPMLRALAPEAEIIARPRFSTLSHVGVTKLSRLPRRSAIVAFSAEEVYAVAEMLRRLRGGCAVVMGALSPRTRNAQVAMFQAGEVDYIVATDAIGMGLNMDVAHVAFASLRKFDGRRTRRLTTPEMAQIAGRAGRHQRDGTFGSLSDGRAGFEPDEVAAIEGHHFAPIEQLYWRCGMPDTTSLDALIGSLEERPEQAALRAAPEAVDLAVLKRLADEEWVRERVGGERRVARLWAACGLPDFRKTGAEQHSRLVARLFRHLSEGAGHVPAPWFAEEVARLDNVQGDVETLADRIASARTWSYIAHRPDWLADPAAMAARTRALEERLSDALHDRLTQRFVDRRTTVLMRDLGARGLDLLPIRIGEDGAVSVDGEPIGRLDGFRFRAAAHAGHAEMRRLLAAAERRLGGEYARRAAALAADPDGALTLATDAGRPVAIFWRGEVVARLIAGRSLLAPRIMLHPSLDVLVPADRAAVTGRLRQWLDRAIARPLAPLARIAAAAGDRAAPPALRALLAPLVEAGGVAERAALAAALAALGDGRRDAVRLGVQIGAMDIFVAALLKPEAVRWRLALLAVRRGEAMPALPPAGAVVLERPAAGEEPLRRAGFRALGGQLLRVDLVERLARQAHDARDGRKPFVPDPALATSLGLRPASLDRLMRGFGFHPAGNDEAGWLWRGRRPARIAPPVPGNAFGALAALRQADG